MDSSTWDRGSSKPARFAGLLVALIVVAPITWLTMLEVDYVLAYAACADSTNGWIHKANTVFTTLLAAAVLSGWWLRRRFTAFPPPVGFLANVALMIAGLTLLVVMATIVPALLLHPCD